MSELQKMIETAVLNKLDVTAIADIIVEKLSSSDEFIKQISQMLLYPDYSRRDSIHEPFVGQVIEKLARKFVEQNAAAIIAKIDLSAVSAGITFRAITDMNSRVKL